MKKVANCATLACELLRLIADVRFKWHAVVGIKY